MLSTIKDRLGDSLRQFGSVIGLVAIIAIVSALNADFLTVDNLFNVLRQVSINALIAFGMTFVILTGGIDLSVGSMLALASAVIGQLMVGGMDFPLALCVGLLAGAVMGAFNGLMVTKGKVAPFIATLATLTVFRGLTLVFTDGRPITGIGQESSFQLFGKGYLLGIIPIPVVVMLIVFALLLFVLRKTVFGRQTYAIGGNEEASILAGVRVDRVKIAIYAISGVLSALAGAILLSRLDSADPNAGSAYELDAIAAVVLGGTSLAGGKGSLVGTLIGALIIGVLNNGLNLLGVSPFYQLVVKGSVILFAVLIDRKKA